MLEQTIVFTSIQNRTLLLGAHPGSELKVIFHHMATDTLPLVFHTKRHGRLICTCEEADAVRVRVLWVVMSKMGRPQRILSKTGGHVRALSEFPWSQGMRKNLNRFLLPATTPQCDKMLTKIIPATTPPYAKPAYTKHVYESIIHCIDMNSGVGWGLSVWCASV